MNLSVSSDSCDRGSYRTINKRNAVRGTADSVRFIQNVSSNARRLLSFYDHFKAAIDHTLPVKRHGVYVRLQARIGHDFLHGLITHVARWPDDPGEDDCLIILALDRH